MKDSPKWLIFISAACFAGFTAAAFATTDNWRFGFLFLISGLFGFVIKYGKFGFTCTFREMLSQGAMKQMRDLIMFLFFATFLCNLVNWCGTKHPLFLLNDSTSKFSDSGAPIGLSLVIGSFIFGIGMNIGSGCASGTLVGMGEGFLKSWEVIWFFIAGATIGSTDPCYNWWSKLPKFSKTTYVPAWANLFILVGLYFLTLIFDYFKNLYISHHLMQSTIELKDVRGLMTQEVQPIEPLYKRLINQVILGFFLALPIGLFYLCTGGMIGVMGTFAKIGANFLKIFGVHPSEWDFFIKNPLPKSMMYDHIFLSDIFIILGAFVAASIAKNFGTSQKKGLFEYLIGILGGLLMGFGARMAGGCNIGTMLSGITSNSMNGYVWMVCAIIGNAVPIYIKKIYDKHHEKSISGYIPVN